MSAFRVAARAVAAGCYSAVLMLPGFLQTAPAQAGLAQTAEPPLVEGKVVLGRLEQVFLSGIPELSAIGIPGKIDTGADTTSIHAEEIHVYSKNPEFAGLKDEALLKKITHRYGGPGSDWWLTEFDTPERNLQTFVTFRLPHPHTGELLEIERPLSRMSVIKARGQKESLYRPVIELDLTIAGRTVHTEVNLADRSGFSYPILIGKTFLRDNGWVDAGFDYLNEQAQARIIGHKERARIEGLSMDVSVSLANRYSALHAQNVQLDRDKRSVSFTLEDREQNQKTITRPLVRMLNVSGETLPLVYIPVQMGQAPGQFNQPLLVYLKDRSDQSAQLRLGSETLNKYFFVDLAAEQLGDQPLLTLAEREQHKPQQEQISVISPLEYFTFEGARISATPSTLINTSVLQVSELRESEIEGKKQLEARFIDRGGKAHSFTAPIIRTITVGGEERLVIRASFEAPGLTLDGEVAVVERKTEPEALDEPQLMISSSLAKGALLVNTRTERLLSKRAPRKVGYIEQLKLEGESIPVKLDTGADLNSLHASGIELFEQDGKQMVRFTFDHSGVEQQFTREVIGEMTIKARAGEQAEPRPIVLMQVSKGEITKTLPFNLRDRADFNYGMILGITLLNEGFWVSSDQQFIVTEQP